MGGFGSGRWGFHTKKTTVEECLILDGNAFLPEFLRAMYRDGGSTMTGTLTWYRREQEVSALGYRLTRHAETYTLHLSYQTRGYSISEAIPLQKTHQPRNGGYRFWLSCPTCLRRTAKLYLPPGSGQFRCRSCHDLTYKSSQESHQFDALYKVIAQNMTADMGRPVDWKEVREVLNHSSR